MDLADRDLWLRPREVAATMSTTGAAGAACLPAVLLGAGASAPHLPVAAELKSELLRLVANVAGIDSWQLDALIERVSQPHITLEVFFSMLRYRCGEAFRPIELWRELCADLPLNPLSRSIGLLWGAGLVGTILTTNFDPMVPSALEALDAATRREFRVLTEWQLELAENCGPTPQDICPLHGTVYEVREGELAPPITATARGLARPFRPAMQRYLATLFQPGRKVVVIGYSGQDHYDVNPLLMELNRAQPDTFRDWLWISHSGDQKEIERVSRLISPDRIVVADAASALSAVCETLGLGTRGKSPILPDAMKSAARQPWRQNLARVVHQFQLPPAGAREFIMDLRRNLPGAWVVLEHYRLYSAGYDERVALVFGGVRSPDDDATGDVEADHLVYLEEPWAVPYGRLLEGQFWYWLEDRMHIEAGGGQDPASLYPRSSMALQHARARLSFVLERAGAGELRAEDRALLLVGLAIAEDYLGLIERKRALLVPADRSRRWESALSHFQTCRAYAQQAGDMVARLVDQSVGGAGGVPIVDDLVQHRVWALIGQANIARTLDDRDAAIAAFVDVIALMQEMIEREQTIARSSRDRGVHNDYLIALYPQLWLRASEMLKTILDCRGNKAPPCSWDQLGQAERQLAEIAMDVCERAYTEYMRFTSRPNSRYHARYEAIILLHVSRAMGEASLSAAERQRALAEAKSALEEFMALARRYPEIRPDWTRNVRGRVAGLQAVLSPL